MTSAVLFFAVAVAAIFASPVPLRNARQAGLSVPASDLGCTEKENKLGVDASQLGEVCDSFLLANLRRTCSALYEADFHDSGVYRIRPGGVNELTVFCDMCMRETGEGWIVIQRRVDNSVAFEDKSWQDYKDGFGDYLGNYWMGLDKIHEITQSGTYDLYISFRNQPHYLIPVTEIEYAVYTNFNVDSEDEYYTMTFDELDNYRSSNGTITNAAGAGLGRHKNLKFSTYDQDNDGISNTDCAGDPGGTLYGGWWFGDDQNSQHCYHVNLNGKFPESIYVSGSGNENAIKWDGIVISQHSLNNTIMAIRRTSN